MRKLLSPQFLIALSTAVLLFVAPASILGQGRGGAPPAQPRPAPGPGPGPGHGPGPGPGGPRGGGHVTVGVGIGYPYWGGGFGWGYYPYYRPWYGYGYGYPWAFGVGWGGWYPPYGYPYYPYYPYGYQMDVVTASVRLEVKPRDAEVYVDGYLAGKVDDFDGTFQRLRVRPGEHDLVLYRDGLRTVTQHLYLGPNSDQRIQFAMEPLAPGEAAEPRPTPPPASEEPPPTSQEPPPGYGRMPPNPPVPNQPPPAGRGAPPPPESQPQEPTSSSFGSLALLIQPGDAQVLVDGASWTMPAGESRLVIRLPEGRHHIEIRKPGFETYVEDVGILRGRTLSLNVSLIRSHTVGGR